MPAAPALYGSTAVCRPAGTPLAGHGLLQLSIFHPESSRISLNHQIIGIASSPHAHYVSLTACGIRVLCDILSDAPNHPLLRLPKRASGSAQRFRNTATESDGDFRLGWTHSRSSMLAGKDGP
ncbi:hypothetical protein RvY_18479-2 [Ramazzottius varieornatus]|uniref:Uncharacterized protein n=1 Tax=Ramazzottius varieornatus TaxID=947166 RepID=A0A1D1W5X9_RAMVA|nr:hypothetical protein RvY_18479-2 [Ramazzottius varieornatus]